MTKKSISEALEGLAAMEPTTFVRVHFAEPSKGSEVKAAEELLGVTLPPSYVGFVTNHGPFRFQHVFRDLSGLGNEFNVLLSPAKLAKTTLDYRKHLKQLAGEGETIAAQVYENAIVFMLNQSDVGVFNPLRTKDGEMATHDFFHDDTPQWSGRFVGFEAYVQTLISKALG